MRAFPAVVAVALLALTVLAAPAAQAVPAPLTAPPAAGVPTTGLAAKDCTRGCTITTADTRWDRLAVTGTINVRAAGFVLTNSRVTAESYYGVLVDNGSATLDRVTITRTSSAALAGDNWTATRLEVADTIGGDGVKLGSNCTLRLSWIHDMTVRAGDHADGVQDGPLTITGNVLGGGNYTLALRDGNGKVIRGISANNNQFLRNFKYGPVVIAGTPVRSFVDNRYFDNGAPISA